MADYNLTFTGDQTQANLQKAADFSGDPLGDGIYAGAKIYTTYQQYTNDNGALFKLNPSVALGYAINVPVYPEARLDPNLIPYTSFESASTEAIDEFNQDGSDAIDEFNVDGQEAINNLSYDVGFKNVGVFGVGVTVQSPQETLTYNSEELNTTAGPFPYTTTGATPTLDGAGWYNVTLEARKTAAISINLLESQVTYANPGTILAEVLHDTSQQKSYSVPAGAIGKTILSVAGNVLNTVEAGSPYTMELANNIALEIEKNNLAERSYKEVSPLGNKNVYMRDGAVPGANAFPSSATSYTAGQEFVRGMFAGTSGTTNVLIDNATGLSWTALTIELRYEIEDTSKFGQGDEAVYIVDNAGVSHWLKVADVSALTSTLVGNLLTVTVDFAIFAELSISSMRQIGLQDIVGVFGEKNANEVINDMQPELLAARSWVNVTTSRVLGVIYTNTSNNSISIAFTGENNASTVAVEIKVNGTRLLLSTSETTLAVGATLTAELQRGDTYEIKSLVGVNTFTWWELR